MSRDESAAATTECRFTPAWQPGTDSGLQRAGKQPSAAQDRGEIHSPGDGNHTPQQPSERSAAHGQECVYAERVPPCEPVNIADGRNEWFDLRPSQEDGYWNSRTYWTRMRQRIHLCTCWACWLEELRLRGC